MRGQGQALRPSQFIFTFGVGSILEAPGGPRMILSFESWGKVFGAGRTPSVSDFAISDSGASALLDGGLIFRIPTNVDLGEAESATIFSTGRFPNWALCAKHGYLFELPLNDCTRCPDCIASGYTGPARSQAIRFVRACPAGHLDDVDWQGILHLNSGRKDCSNTIYKWRTEGGSLRDVVVDCDCKASATLQDFYRETRRCSGRFPEKGESFASCGEEAKVTLRGSSSIRIPEIVTTITLPRFASTLHRKMDSFQMRTILSTRKQWSKADLVTALQNMAEQDPSILDPNTLDEINSASDERLREVINDIRKFSRNRPTTIQAIREEEFRELQEAAEFGHPPDPDSENPEFQVNKFKVRKNIPLGKYRLRAAPVERLRVVAVQKGYRRLGTNPMVNKLIPTFYDDGQHRWFPGVEEIGEAIFIDAPGSPILPAAQDWDDVFRAEQTVESHPAFVWWHTLSHRIISALSIDSGYSSASIRENVYTLIDQKNGKVSGGVLLYTAQPSGDGSLGGLISLVPDIESVLAGALRDIDYCSNDPLCSETNVKIRGNNGAACYACLFLSETSCAYSNAHLDRNLLRRNL